MKMVLRSGNASFDGGAARARRRRLDVAREGNDGVDRVCSWGPRDGTRAGDARPHRANEDFVPKGGFQASTRLDATRLDH
jgi:hypothetical protein